MTNDKYEKKPLSRQELDKIKLIAFDMDGTLLNEKGVLSQTNNDAILRAMDKGFHIVIATGRCWSALPQDVLDVPGIQYAITSNGASIVERATGETIYTNLLTRSAVEAALPWISDPAIMREVFFDHYVYADKHCMDDLAAYGITTEKSQKYVLSTRIPVEDTIQLVKTYADKLENINLIFADMDMRRRFQEELSKNEDLTVVSSMPYNIELGGASTSKASALEALAERLGLTQENIMSFGDSTNDAEMLSAARIGVAMGNAVPELLAAADYITKTNVEDGVAFALKELLNI